MGNLRLLELMEGARNCVKGWANVQQDENILIYEDRSGFADPLVIDAVALAAREAGADVTVATCKEFEPRLEDPPKVMTSAILAADVVFIVSSHEALLHSPVGRQAMFEYGVRLIPVVANNAELMSSEWAKFPSSLVQLIQYKVCEQFLGGKTFRIVSANGTDVSAGIQPMGLMGFPTDLRGYPGPMPPGIGNHAFFPGGCVGIIPRHDGNGIIVYDSLLGWKGILKDPVRLVVKDCKVVDVEGGEEAKWFKDLIEEKRGMGLPFVDQWVEIMWGVNPKASIKRGLEIFDLRESEVTRRAGTLHCGIGPGGQGFHWDGVLIKPFSAFIDDNPIIEDGRLTALDDPEVRSAAEKYGNPDEVLALVS